MRRSLAVPWAPTAAIYLAPLAIVIALAWPELARPFHGDQALFLYGAQVLSHGGVLYRDFWDNKQPGVYLFYLAGGELFGFSALGIHTFELIYLLAFGACQIAMLRQLLRHRWLAAVAPVATIGVYYAYTTGWHQTQLEILVTFPLFLSIWSSTAAVEARPGPRRTWLALLAGVMAGIVALFKLVLAPIPAVGWLLLMASRRPDERPATAIRTLWIPLAAGVLLVLAGWAAAFWVADALPQLLWTSFVYPLVASAVIPRAHVARLVQAVRWFLRGAVQWLALAFTAGIAWRGRRREALTVQLVSWAVMGAVAILAQKFSWWEYHFLLLIVPVGLLAIRGIDGVITWLTRWDTRAATAGGVLLAMLAMAPTLNRGVSRLHSRAELSELMNQAARIRWQRAADPTYDTIWRETRFLRAPDALAGPIYVFGNPLYVVLSHRQYAIPVHGWSWEVLVPKQWAALPAALARAAPAYVFLSRNYAGLVTHRAPGVITWLKADYRLVEREPEGDWYRRSGARAHVASARSVAAIGARAASHAG